MENRPQKVLPYKTYNKIGHLSKSRLGEGDHVIDLKTEEQFTKLLTDPHAVVIVQEKLDGSNVCVVRYEGRLRVLSRSGYDCEHSNQEQHRMFYRWVVKNRDRFENLLMMEGDRVVGEWIALAHGTIYHRIRQPFVAFDLYSEDKSIDFVKRERELHHYQFITPEVLHIGGACSTNRAIKLLETSTYHACDETEGVIYRMERHNKEPIIAKLVKHNKIDGKYIKEGQEIWNWKE